MLGIVRVSRSQNLLWPLLMAGEYVEMSEGKQLTGPDPFYRDRIFPDIKAILHWTPSSIESSLDNCLVVLDANVLLAPYRVGAQSLNTITQTYQELADTRRLFVPEQVLREYAANRAEAVLSLRRSVKGVADRIQIPPLNVPSVVAELDEFRNVDEVHSQILEMKTNLLKGIGVLTDRVEGWISDDPVRKAYAPIFESSLYRAETDKKEIALDHQYRITHKRPPGYLDASKIDGGIGDTVIWHTILRLGSEFNRDVIFVTNEKKPDWWEKDGDKLVSPRSELLEEYRSSSGGKTFHLASLSNFLKLRKVDRRVVNEVIEAEQSSEMIVSTYSDITTALVIQQEEEEGIRTIYRSAQRALAPWILSSSHSPHFAEFVLSDPLQSQDVTRLIILPGLWRTDAQYEQFRKLLSVLAYRPDEPGARAPSRIVYLFVTEEPRPEDFLEVLMRSTNLQTVHITRLQIPPRLAAATTYPIIREMVFSKDVIEQMDWDQ